MTYRNDLDALAARQAALQAEVQQKQRELAGVSGMLAEVRQADQAERYFERAPDLRRRQRHQLLAGALVMLLGSGVALGAAAAAAVEEGERRAEAAPERGVIVRIRSVAAAREAARRAPAQAQTQAQDEALRALGLIPVTDPFARWRPSAAGKDER